jgi:hypothetical protein
MTCKMYLLFTCAVYGLKNKRYARQPIKVQLIFLSHVISVPYTVQLQIIQSARLSVQSELGLPPQPLTRKQMLLPPSLWVQGGRHTCLRGMGVGGPNFKEGTDTLVVYVKYNPSTSKTSFLNPFLLLNSKYESPELTKYTVVLD